MHLHIILVHMLHVARRDLTSSGLDTYIINNAINYSATSTKKQTHTKRKMMELYASRIMKKAQYSRFVEEI